MALRWRVDGRLLCAAKTLAEPGDTYIGDQLHYELAVVLRLLEADADEEATGKWHWRNDGLVN